MDTVRGFSLFLTNLWLVCSTTQQSPIRQPLLLMFHMGGFMQNIPWYERIKQARLAHGLSQREAAALLDIDEKTYQRWEAGKHLPNFAGRRALRDQFGISPD